MLVPHRTLDSQCLLGVLGCLHLAVARHKERTSNPVPVLLVLAYVLSRLASPFSTHHSIASFLLDSFALGRWTMLFFFFFKYGGWHGHQWTTESNSDWFFKLPSMMNVPSAFSFSLREGDLYILPISVQGFLLKFSLLTTLVCFRMVMKRSISIHSSTHQIFPLIPLQFHDQSHSWSFQVQPTQYQNSTVILSFCVLQHFLREDEQPLLIQGEVLGMKQLCISLCRCLSNWQALF